MDLFGSESKSIQLKQIRPNTTTRIKKEPNNHSIKSPSPEYYTPTCRTPEPQTIQSHSAENENDLTIAPFGDTIPAFITKPKEGSSQQNGIESLQKPKASSSKKENQIELGRIRKKDKDVPQLCSTREKKKTIPFDEKESEEIGIFLTPKALKAQVCCNHFID